MQFFFFAFCLSCFVLVRTDMDELSLITSNLSDFTISTIFIEIHRLRRRKLYFFAGSCYGFKIPPMVLIQKNTHLTQSYSTLTFLRCSPKSSYFINASSALGFKSELVQLKPVKPHFPRSISSTICLNILISYNIQFAP